MFLWPRTARPARIYRATVARRPRLVVVVGSLGKTTTKHAVAGALAIPPDRVPEHNCFGFLAMASLRIRPWARHAVIEAGINGPGQMAFYARMLRPDITVVTSIASEHRRTLLTAEATRMEKSEMVRALRPSGCAVLNGDDPHVMWMRERTCARITTFGFGAENDVRATDVALRWPEGMQFRLHARGRSHPVHTKLVGSNFIYALLAAATVGLEEGYTLDELIPRLEAIPPVDERMEPVHLPNGAIVLRDDYKATLESVDAALDLLEQIPARRKIVVLGDVDSESDRRANHRRLGGRIGEIATQAIFVGGDNQGFAAGAFRTGLAREAMTKAGTDLARAIDALPSDLGPGDVVLVKGSPRQRLGRVALALSGRTVRCLLPSCPLAYVRCKDCTMLERDWGAAEANGNCTRLL
ncbi:MAG: Mur ligase family protein [Opitutaceae bacterium]